MQPTMHSCTASKNCMAIAQFYNYIIDILWKANLLLKNHGKKRLCNNYSHTYSFFILGFLHAIEFKMGETKLPTIPEEM